MDEPEHPCRSRPATAKKGCEHQPPCGCAHNSDVHALLLIALGHRQHCGVIVAVVGCSCAQVCGMSQLFFGMIMPPAYHSGPNHKGHENGTLMAVTYQHGAAAL